MSVSRLSTRMTVRGACADEAKTFSTSPDPALVDQMEGLPVVALLVCDVVHRRGHVVDGDEVRVAELEADQREPLREGVPQLLDRLEEVVGTVDLVHLAGLRVPDDQ